MNRIEARFETLKASGKSAFIPFITAGDPSLDATVELVLALERAGADIVEFGIPFSDPVGDGPVIQAAAQRALAGGATLPKLFDAVGRIRQQSEIPILLFSYFNPILARTLPAFARDAAEAGADGVLCVDLPPEEADEYRECLGENGLCTVFLTAPTTNNARLELVSKQCTGFVYYVSRLGVTGERSELELDLNQALERIKAHTAKPVAVGFGISTPEQAAKVAGMADGVVVGSAIVRQVAEHGQAPDLVERIENFARALNDAVKSC